MEKLNMNFWREDFEEQIKWEKPGDAWRLTMDQSLKPQAPSGWKRSLQEHAVASFRCSQCFHSWSSHQVVILFHMQWEPRRRQGSIKMRLFRQQCHNCGSEKYEKPEFTKEALGSILKRLIFDIRKTCYREQRAEHELLEVISHVGGPHRREYCEACKLGIHKSHYGIPRGTGHHEKPTTRKTHSTVFSQDIKNGGMVKSTFGFPECCCICCIIITVAVIILIACLIWGGKISGAL